MITDEQVKSLMESVGKLYFGYHDMQKFREALEAYEAGKWVKFDVDDKSTFPTIDKDSDYLSIPVNTSTGFTVRFSYRSYEWVTEDGCFVDERISYENLYWQPLPEFKE